MMAMYWPQLLETCRQHHKTDPKTLIGDIFVFLLALETPTQPQVSKNVFIKQEMKDIEIKEGSDAKFDVRVDGADKEVDWYRDDELLEDAGRIIIEDPHPESNDNLYSLTIENCGPNDSGKGE